MYIKDDYVPFETAMLMDKHGYESLSDIAYDKDGEMFNALNEPFRDVECYTPTIANALKWLREAHGLYADVFIIDYAPEPWIANIHKYNDEIEMVTVYHHSGKFFKTYEDAANYIIGVCLEKYL